MVANTSESVQEDNDVEHSVRQLNNIGNVLKEPVGIGNIVTEPVNTTSTYREPVKVGYTITDCGNIANKVTEPVHMGDTTNEHRSVVGLANKPMNTKHIRPEHLNIGAESNTENVRTVQVHIEDITKEPSNTGITSGSPVNVENVKLETGNAFLNTPSSIGSVDQVYAMDTIDHELDRIHDKGTGDQIIEDTTKTDSSSSDSSSDSDDESSSSESSTSSDDDLEDIRREIEKEEEQVLKGPPRTKSEVLAKDLPEIPELDITIDDDVQLVELGVIFSIVESMVVVKALPQTPALDSDSILFMGNRSCLGLVFETFGPVQTPFYSVRFNRESDICSKNVHVGDKVFYAPDVMEYSHYVFVAQLKKLKGSDASWEHDEEPPPEAVEYSDDEEESKARASRRKERMAKSGSKTDESTLKTGESRSHFHQGFKRGNRKRTWQNHAKGKTVTQNQNEGMPPSNSVPIPHPAYRGPTPWSGSASPLQASERPYMGPLPHEAMHFQGLSEGPPRGVPPLMLPPIGPPSSVPMGHIPLTEPGPMINVPRPPFGPPRPFGGGPGVQNPWPGSPSPGFSHRYPIPAPQHFQNPRGNIQSFPGREFMVFGVPPPPPPPTPPPM
ncbi:uncharacterized protein [Porites lutea]|uniref:uncharacterized protein n=1 Tax=Porites lutea TaxID=51062 RepID=UPI003CC532DA